MPDFWTKEKNYRVAEGQGYKGFHYNLFAEGDNRYDVGKAKGDWRRRENCLLIYGVM